MVFDEESISDWNRQQVTPIILDDDVEKKEQQTKILEKNVSIAEESSLSLVTSKIPLPISWAATDSVQHFLCIRKRSVSMRDYEAMRVNYNEEYVTHFTLFIDCDPTTFECVVNELKQRNAMMMRLKPLKKLILGNFVIF